jgi:hypothetical protein
MLFDFAFNEKIPPFYLKLPYSKVAWIHYTLEDMLRA